MEPIVANKMTLGEFLAQHIQCSYFSWQLTTILKLFHHSTHPPLELIFAVSYRLEIGSVFSPVIMQVCQDLFSFMWWGSSWFAILAMCQYELIVEDLQSTEAFR